MLGFYCVWIWFLGISLFFVNLVAALWVCCLFGDEWVVVGFVG